jgi:hypothetical protein
MNEHESELFRDKSEQILNGKLDMRQERGAIRSSLRELHDRREEQRWGALMMAALLLKEITEPARYMFSYPTSWAHKIADAWLSVPGMACFFFFAAALLLPRMAMLIVAPESHHMPSMAKLSGIGLAMAAFGFAMLAFLARRVDAPQAVDTWVGSAAMCVAFMLFLGARANNRQRREKGL